MSIMFPKANRGFALVTAIFLLVVLAALGGYVATVSTSQQVGSALDVLGARAYWAARAGAEWGLYQALHPAATPCAASTDIGTVDTMAVTVTCSSQATDGLTDAGVAASIYTITATACNFPNGTACPGLAGNANYVERRVTVVTDSSAQ